MNPKLFCSRTVLLEGGLTQALYEMTEKPLCSSKRQNSLRKHDVFYELPMIFISKTGSTELYGHVSSLLHKN